MLFVVSSYLIVLLLFSGCSKEAVYREEIKERISEKEALKVLYNHLYEEQETIETVTFVEAGEHTECNIEWEDDRVVSIQYWGITDDELYMLFRLSSVESTLNFYAVNRETKEVIIQRIEDDDRGYMINKEYTKALAGTRNADVQYFCGIDYEILYDQYEIRNVTIQRIEDYFKTSIPELEEYEAYIKAMEKQLYILSLQIIGMNYMEWYTEESKMLNLICIAECPLVRRGRMGTRLLGVGFM